VPSDSVIVTMILLPGGPFPPGNPCRTAEKYDVEKIDKNGCKYTIKLSVTEIVYQMNITILDLCAM
jgi:hypothetical protein